MARVQDSGCSAALLLPWEAAGFSGRIAPD